MDPRFAHIDDWIFDLDNTLYPASTRLFDLIDERMTAYVGRVTARPVERGGCRKYFRDLTTLAGLMKLRGRAEDFLYDFLRSRLTGSRRTNGSSRLGTLPGRRSSSPR